MSDRCVENTGEFGVELNVSDTIKEIIDVLHGGEKPLHKVVYDIQSGQFGFVFDDGRFKHLLQLGQEPSEEVKKLKILLDETLDRMKILEREHGAAIAQAAASKKSAMKADAEKKEVLEKLRAKEKKFVAEKKAWTTAEVALQKKLEEAIRARRRAEAKAAESEAQATRMKQAKDDVKDSGEEVKAGLRSTIEDLKRELEKVRKRAANSENNYREVSKQLVEEKDMRNDVQQRLGDVTVMLEAAQQQLQEVEKAKAVEVEETQVASTQTELKVVELATQTEGGLPGMMREVEAEAKEAVTMCIASVQTEAMGGPDAQSISFAEGDDIVRFEAKAEGFPEVFVNGDPQGFLQYYELGQGAEEQTTDEKTLIEKRLGEDNYFPRDAWSVKDASKKKLQVREVTGAPPPETIMGANSDVVTGFVGTEFRIAGVKTMHRDAKVFTGVYSAGPNSYTNQGLQAKCEFVYQLEMSIRKERSGDYQWIKGPCILCWAAWGMLFDFNKTAGRECGFPIVMLTNGCKLADLMT